MRLTFGFLGEFLIKKATFVLFCSVKLTLDFLDVSFRTFKCFYSRSLEHGIILGIRGVVFNCVKKYFTVVLYILKSLYPGSIYMFFFFLVWFLLLLLLLQ